MDGVFRFRTSTSLELGAFAAVACKSESACCLLRTCATVEKRLGITGWRGRMSVGFGRKVAVAVLAGAWLGLVLITLRALLERGLNEGLEVFFTDFAHPWRAQFYLDLEVHLLLIASWIIYRSRFSPAGLFACRMDCGFPDGDPRCNLHATLPGRRDHCRPG